MTSSDIPNMPFGAIVGKCQMIDCVRIGSYHAYNNYRWLTVHIHTEGPYCFVLNNVERFAEPIPYVGKQGLFDVPDAIVEQALSKD